ncbi:hypothetical protein OG738_05815 [Amycolatopsis sp. NBC_01488]|uniref:hypothetical protein n=1 Tax=Amycolatopsis sp. NBC_01488 TaxID=2903563 RepID=UPI002E2B16DF|nr:hypothetical protein [Amycolatopsis sp. NBC_01488]
MEDVRAALTAYVTEGEPPLGLTGEEVLSAARLSRRRYLLTGAVALFVVVLALGLAVVVLPHRGEVASAPCPSASGTRAQITDRLSCLIGNAVRSMLDPRARISRLTSPGETPPADPFHLIADPAGAAPREALFHLGVRVTDARGSGSVYVLVLPTGNAGGPPCGGTPEEVVCRSEPTPQGQLWLSTLRSGEVVTHRVALAAPDVFVQFSANNSGVLAQKDVRLPAQRPEPTLTLAQVRDLALTPGLGF